MATSQDSVFVVKSMKGYKARMALLDAALRLIAVNGVSGFSIGDLCDEAGIKRTSFYTYFKTIDDLLEELSLREESGFDQEFARLYGDMKPGIRRLFISVIGFFEIALENDVWNKAVIRLMAEHQPTIDRNTQSVVDDIDAAIADGEVVLTPLQAGLFKNLVLSTLQHIESDEFKREPRQYLEALCDVLLTVANANEIAKESVQKVLAEI
ncbi:MAG: TetR/AcrR family transcriptional regulator [Pseudomonadota bacterium]